jgi:hypothetical protein
VVGDDLGRERLARYGARLPLSLERLRRLPGGRGEQAQIRRPRAGAASIAAMTGIEFMAMLAAIIASTLPPGPIRGSSCCTERLEARSGAQAARATRGLRSGARCQACSGRTPRAPGCRCAPFAPLTMASSGAQFSHSTIRLQRRSLRVPRVPAPVPPQWPPTRPHGRCQHRSPLSRRSR